MRVIYVGTKNKNPNHESFPTLPPIKTNTTYSNLTKGKVYDCITKPSHNRHNMVDNYYYVIDDLGKIFGFHKSEFITIEEFREQQLTNIGI